MPTYEMRAPNGRTYRIQGPAGATDAQVKAKILEQHPEAARAAPAPKAKPKPKAKPRNRGTGIGALDTTLDVINEALIGIPEGAYNAAAMITDPLAGLIVGKKAVKKAQKQRKEAVGAVARTFVTKPRPIAREVGRAVLPAAGVTRAASLAAPVLQKAPVVGNALARIATATASGGIGSGRTAAQTAALTKGQRVAQLGERMVGGAISGGATAGLMGQDIGEGALFGAGLPVVANVLKRVGGKAIDLARLPKLKAAEIIRESLGENLDEARAAFAQLSPDDQRLARQVLIEADIEPDTFMGLGADVERLRPEQTRRVLEGQAATREAALADISGGTTATERRQAIDLGRGAVSAVTTPLREAALQGRGPVEVAPIIATLRSQANSEGVRTSAARGALLRLAKNIENGADEAGFISPANLYTIRKEAGDTIEKLVSSKQQPSSGAKKRTASIVMGFRQIVDDALGPDFKSYLARHREGMSAMDRQELAAEAANLAQTNPNQFINLMRGGRDETVENVMGRGTGQYDIGALETTDPRRYATMMNAVQEFETLNRMKELGRSGATAASELIGRERPFLSRSLTRMGLAPFPPARIATEGGEAALAALLQPRVRDRLANAFVSGPGMREAMEQYPTAFNFSEQVSRVPAGLRNVMAQGAVRPFTADFPEIDPETGEILLEVGFNEDGSTYPIYGRPPAR
jgi:hypothetical protein